MKGYRRKMNMNISSIVVKTTPEHIQDVLADLNGSELCDVHFHDEHGRIIVTIEGENVGVELEKMMALQRADHVISAELVYSYNEEELANAREFLDNVEDSVPGVLEEENPDARKVKYGGSLKM